MSRGGSARQRRNQRRESERLVAAGLSEAHGEESTGVEDAQPTDDAAALATDDSVAEVLLAETVAAEVEEPEEFDVDAALESLEEFANDMGSCADCGHAYDMHDAGGACSMDECSCKQFADDTDNDGDSGGDVEGDGHAIKASLSIATGTAADAGGLLPASVFNLQNVQFIDERGNVLVYTPITTTDTTTSTAGTFQPALLEEEATVPVLDQAAATGVRWVATLCPEGKATADGRIFAPGSITWRELPLSLMGMIETAEGHNGAQVCGRIDRVWRDEATGEIMGSGVFDAGEFGGMIARLVGDGTLRGVSVDIAVAAMEIAPRDEVVDAEGNWVGQSAAADDEPKEEVDPIDILFGGEDMMFVVLEGVIGAATVCPFPAFAEAKIEVASSLVAAAKAPNVWTVTSQAGFRVTGNLEAALTASAAVAEEIGEDEEIRAEGELTAGAATLAPLHPPAFWFDSPDLDELTPLTVTDEGRVFGHVAPWGVCHIGIPGVCTTAPQTETGYAYYMTKEIVTEDGFRITVGTITMDTDHAGRDVGRQAAASHYDNTGVAAADVVIGEDEFGIWMAGAIRPDLSAEKLRALQGASVSGDWREVNGNLELVGVLAVNVPGFPIPRLRASLVASGDGMAVTSLVAAGIIGREPVEGALNRADLAELANLAAVASSEWDELALIAKGDAA